MTHNKSTQHDSSVDCMSVSGSLCCRKNSITVIMKLFREAKKKKKDNEDLYPGSGCFALLWNICLNLWRRQTTPAWNMKDRKLSLQRQWRGWRRGRGAQRVIYSQMQNWGFVSYNPYRILIRYCIFVLFAHLTVKPSKSSHPASLNND